MRQMPLYSAAVFFFSNAALIVMPVLYTNRRHEGRNYNHFPSNYISMQLFVYFL